MIDVRLVNGQDQFALASFLVEIHPQDLVLRKGHLVEGIPDMAGLLRGAGGRAATAVLPEALVVGHSEAGDEVLELFVVLRADQKNVTCVNHDIVLETFDGVELFLVSADQHAVLVALTEDLFREHYIAILGLVADVPEEGIPPVDV